MPSVLTVYACQTDPVWEDKPASFARVEKLLETTRPSPQPGGLIVLPEMFATGFSMNARAIAEDAWRGETAGFLAALARTYGCHVLAGVVILDPENPGERPHNEALILAPDGMLAGRYQKRRPFTPSGERDRYAAGTCPIVVKIGGLRVAPLICYDLRFPELFRDCLSPGVDAFVVIASWPAARIAHWSTLLRARAIENQAYVVGVNRVGDDPAPLHYPGASVVIGPDGTVLAHAGETETVLTAALDADFVREYREKLPFLNDR